LKDCLGVVHMFISQKERRDPLPQSEKDQSREC